MCQSELLQNESMYLTCCPTAPNDVKEPLLIKSNFQEINEVSIQIYHIRMLNADVKYLNIIDGLVLKTDVRRFMCLLKTTTINLNK